MTFVFCYRLCLKVYFVRYEYYYPSFPVVSIFVKYPFPSSHFHNVCIFSFESEVLLSSFQMALDFYPISHPISFDWCI